MKKNVCFLSFFLKITSFTVFCGLLLLKFDRHDMIGTAVDFYALMVFSPSRCQVTKLHFPRLYKFSVSIDK